VPAESMDEVLATALMPKDTTEPGCSVPEKP
jgi:hypothetical protein